VCADLGVTTGIMQQCYAKSELAKVIGIEFADQLFYHSKKMQELNLTIDDIAVLRSCRGGDHTAYAISAYHH
jgi:hypothetical protein